ncbi:hypothetical protein GOV08_05450 [Candidatus Woesearchaeota archaeon]|nr:hypothetical protein [Candidatus Woesearchaeota archaeon]
MKEYVKNLSDVCKGQVCEFLLMDLENMFFRSTEFNRRRTLLSAEEIIIYLKNKGQAVSRFEERIKRLRKTWNDQFICKVDFKH